MDNQQWIGSLIEAYERPLGRYAYSLTGSLSSAQDAVQETFLRLCKAKRAKVEGHEAAWLFRVCRSRVFDMKRKERPVQALTSMDTNRLAAPTADPAETAIHADAERWVPRLISQLPERQAEVIRLKFQQGLSYRDIARVMNLSESHVGVLIHTGIRTLREQVKHLQGVQS